MVDFTGRLLCIDHGTQFIGLATCDAIGLITKPLQVLKRKSRDEDFATLQAIIAREQVVGIVMGLPPRPAEFVGTSQSDIVRNWTKRFIKHLHQQNALLPFYYWDEGLSSYDAEQTFKSLGKARPERVDAHAAAVILQSLLDAVREGTAFPAPLKSSIQSESNQESES